METLFFLGAAGAALWSGAFTGVLFSPNLFTVGVASLLGIPGVIAMLIFKLIFRA